MNQISNQLVCKINMIKFGCFAFHIVVAALLTAALNACDSEKVLMPSFSNVHGAVVDQNGKPIPGAKVAARRAQVQTVTDENGEYALPKAEALDGPDTLDMTDNKLIRVAMPITWKVKRFEDAVVVKRKVTGSVAGDLGGLSKARIHWRTKGTVEGIPQVVDLVKGSYQGEIATLFSKDSLEVQIFLLDTALRVVGKSRFLQINPRSGNIVVPAFPKLNTFEPLSPLYGCGQMGSWDTCTVLLAEPEDSATKMWFREGGDVWAEFQGTFVIPPRLRRIAPWMKERLHTEIEILRKDSAGVERLDTIRVPWKKNLPFSSIIVLDGKRPEFNAKVPDFITTAKVTNRIQFGIGSHSTLDSLIGQVDYGYSEYFTYESNCTKGGCQRWSETTRTPTSRLFASNGEICEIIFPRSGAWWISITSRTNSGETSTDTVFFGVDVPTPPVYDLVGTRFNRTLFEIEFKEPLSRFFSFELDCEHWGCSSERGALSGVLMPDKKTVQFSGIDSLWAGDSVGLMVRDFVDENESHSMNQKVWIPRTKENQALEARFKDALLPFVFDYISSNDSIANMDLSGAGDGFDVKFEMPSFCAKDCAAGAVFWKAPSAGQCNQKLRFRAKATDSTLV